MNKPEDRWGKVLFQGLFGSDATIEVGSELIPAPVLADILLFPKHPLPEEIPGAGLFARLTGARYCVVEPYSTAPTPLDLRTSMAKLQLVLRQAYQDKEGRRPVRGCLWILSRYSATKAIEEVFEIPASELEVGLYRWSGVDPIYFVNTSQIQLREETLLFRMLAKGRQREEAIATIIQQNLEPYYSLLTMFAKELSIMSEIQEGLSATYQEQLDDLKGMYAFCEKAVLETTLAKGREEGREEGRKEIAKKMLLLGEPLEKIASLTGLSTEDIQALQ